MITDGWELAALLSSPRTVKRAWAPLLYCVDGLAFLLVIVGLFFIFWATMWGSYVTDGMQMSFSWGMKETITWALLSAVG